MPPDPVVDALTLPEQLFLVDQANAYYLEQLREYKHRLMELSGRLIALHHQAPDAGLLASLPTYRATSAAIRSLAVDLLCGTIQQEHRLEFMAQLVAPPLR